MVPASPSALYPSTWQPGDCPRMHPAHKPRTLPLRPPPSSPAPLGSLRQQFLQQSCCQDVPVPKAALTPLPPVAPEEDSALPPSDCGPQSGPPSSPMGKSGSAWRLSGVTRLPPHLERAPRASPQPVRQNDLLYPMLLLPWGRPPHGTATVCLRLSSPRPGSVGAEAAQAQEGHSRGQLR